MVTCRTKWDRSHCKKVSSDEQHKAVLLEEVLVALNIKANGNYIDATFGRGGHARAILSQLDSHGQLLALDRDSQAISAAAALTSDPRFHIEQAPFSEIVSIASKYDLLGKVDGILFDLGVSSPQLDNAERGFSFQHDGPLDMRMDRQSGQSAAQWLASADEKEIANVIKTYGEERFSRRIARRIVQTREEQEIDTTAKLAAIVSQAIPKYEPGKHPATRTFQAIRIFINNELDELRQALDQVLTVLRQGGRLLFISFHSLEDRMVKQCIRKLAKGDPYPPDMPVTDDALNPVLKIIGKPVRPTDSEIQGNPRARSATLRVAEYLGGHDG